jgi:Putative peptidoglycan binding domain
MFDGYPSYDRYRTLRRRDPMMRGEDVLALQTALVALGQNTGGADGIFGDATERAVKKVQDQLNITVDGLAGGGTQQAVTRRIADRARDRNDLPKGLVFGQCMHESSCRLGNYSAQHSFDVPGGPYFDAGVAQRNVRFHPQKDAFDVPDSINLLGKHVAAYFRLYAGVSNLRRRWELAAGSWNAPAFTGRIADDEGATVGQSEPSWWPDGVMYVGKARSVGPESRAKIETYMDSATAFMVL